MNEIIFLVEESLEGGYEARALETSIHTEADTIVNLREAIRDAVRCHYDEKEMPSLLNNYYLKRKD